MDEWQQNWWEILEKTASNLEKLMEDVGTTVESFTEEVEENVDRFVEQLQDSFFSEIDRCVEDFVETIVEIAAISIEEIVIIEEIEPTENWDYSEDELDFMGIYQEKPNLTQNPACIGCQNYHGRVYNGNLLVCGIHPYGWTDDNCPDWEEKLIA